MMLRYTFGDEANAKRIESAVKAVLAKGIRTVDIMTAGGTEVSCSGMGDAVVAELKG